MDDHSVDGARVQFMENPSVPKIQNRSPKGSKIGCALAPDKGRQRSPPKALLYCLCLISVITTFRDPAARTRTCATTRHLKARLWACVLLTSYLPRYCCSASFSCEKMRDNETQKHVCKEKLSLAE